MFDSSFSESKGTNGFKTLQYVGQTGALEIMAHPYQKDGLCHIITPSEAKRIGARALKEVYGRIIKPFAFDPFSRAEVVGSGERHRLVVDEALIARALKPPI